MDVKNKYERLNQLLDNFRDDINLLGGLDDEQATLTARVRIMNETVEEDRHKICELMAAFIPKPEARVLTDEQMVDIFYKHDFSKIQIIREVRNITFDGLKEVKDLVEAFAEKRGFVFSR